MGYAYLLVMVTLAAGAHAGADDFGLRLARAAFERMRQQVVYDGAYYRIAFPGGDVPSHVGVCTDVVIRSYRTLGFDLQQAVHEDMTRHFAAYPSRRIWGLDRPDPNIDHTYFLKKGREEFNQPVSKFILRATLLVSLCQMALTVLHLSRGTAL